MKSQNTRGTSRKSGTQSPSTRPQTKARRAANGKGRGGDWQTSEAQTVAPRKRERQAPTLTEGFGAGTASNSGQGERKRQITDPDHARLADRDTLRGGTKMGR